jgi:hypothetical protein
LIKLYASCNDIITAEGILHLTNLEKLVITEADNIKPYFINNLKKIKKIIISEREQAYRFRHVDKNLIVYW